jgi:hypothetical protein
VSFYLSPHRAEVERVLQRASEGGYFDEVSDDREIVRLAVLLFDGRLRRTVERVVRLLLSLSTVSLVGDRTRSWPRRAPK